VNSRLLAFLVLCLPLAVAVPSSAQAMSRGCDQCADLPTLYRELLEQEFLRNRFDRWIREAYYPASIDAMQSSAVKSLDAAMSGDLYGVLAPSRSAGGSISAAPAYGTDPNSSSCQLVEYGKDKDGKTTQRPVTPEQVRATLCKPLADYTLAHEGHHQATCRAGGLKTVEQFVQDDRAAYQAGVAVLRQHIADLARRCSWSGSTNARRPDGTATVPTPQQISDLKSATKSKANLLNRASR
jgi:hypothetical protein